MEKTKVTKPTTKKADEISRLKEEIKRLENRLTEKDKETAAIEQELEQKADHLQFMNNALRGDNDRLQEKYSNAVTEAARAKQEVAYLLEKLDGQHYTFAQRVRILFTGKA